MERNVPVIPVAASVFPLTGYRIPPASGIVPVPVAPVIPCVNRPSAIAGGTGVGSVQLYGMTVWQYSPN